MEKEDPIEKLERKQAEKKSNGGLKAVMIAMIIIALALGAALYYVLTSKNKLVNELNEEKVDLTEQIIALMAKTSSNAEFFDKLKGWLAVFEKEGYTLGGKV